MEIAADASGSRISATRPLFLKSIGGCGHSGNGNSSWVRRSEINGLNFEIRAGRNWFLSSTFYQYDVNHSTMPNSCPSFLVTPGRDVQMRCAKAFLDELNRFTNTAICMLCGISACSNYCVETSMTNLLNLDTLQACTSHPAQVLTNNMLLQPGSYHDGKGKLCVLCAEHVRKNKTPCNALSNGLWIGEIPDVLGSLTLVEKMLVTMRFPGASRLTLFSDRAGLNDDGTVRYDVNTRLFDGMDGDGLHLDELPLNGRMLEKVLEIDVSAVWGLATSAIPDCLRIRKKHVSAALNWLIANNPLYAKIQVNRRVLHNLPESGYPPHLTHGAPSPTSGVRYSNCECLRSWLPS